METNNHWISFSSLHRFSCSLFLKLCICRLFLFSSRMHILVYVIEQHQLYQKMLPIRYLSFPAWTFRCDFRKPWVNHSFDHWTIGHFFPRIIWISSSVPCNVQIRLWESDLNRVEATPANFYEEFPSKVTILPSCSLLGGDLLDLIKVVFWFTFQFRIIYFQNQRINTT